MWTQVITARLKPGRDADLPTLARHMRSIERPGSGLLRSTMMQDQKDPSRVQFMVVFESEAKARERENDTSRQADMTEARQLMAEIFDGPFEFADFNVIDDAVYAA